MNKQQIINELLDAHRNFAQYVTHLDERDFTYAPPQKWSAGQQLDHLLRAVSPLVLAFSLPQLLLRLFFGKADHPSRSYADMVAMYQGALNRGAKATGRFVPPKAIAFASKEVLKNKLLDTVSRLCNKISRCSEESLDKRCVPHPLLGKLTLREILYFTIYHVQHHHKSITEHGK